MNFNKTHALVIAAVAIGSATPSLISGFYWGAAEMEVITRAPTCTVQDQELANYQRTKTIGAEILKLQDTKARLVNETLVAEARLKALLAATKAQVAELGYAELQLKTATDLTDSAHKMLRVNATKSKSVFDN